MSYSNAKKSVDGVISQMLTEKTLTMNKDLIDLANSCERLVMMIRVREKKRRFFASKSYSFFLIQSGTCGKIECGASSAEVTKTVFRRCETDGND